MSLERNGKSANDVVKQRIVRRWVALLLGLVLGWISLPLAIFALGPLLPSRHTYGVIFVKLDLPDAGVSRMMLDGRIMDHLYVSPHIVVTREKTAPAPTATLTFDFRRSRGETPERISIELTVAEEWRRHCKAEIVLTQAGAINRGCLSPIKQLF